MTEYDELEDWEYPEPDEEEQDECQRDDCLDMVKCPNCGAAVYEQAEQCPECREYIVPTDRAALSGWPSWFVALGLVGIGVTVLALSCGLQHTKDQAVELHLHRVRRSR